MRAAVAICLLAATAGLPTEQAWAARPLVTAVQAGGGFDGAQGELAFQRVRATGATAIRLEASWVSIAPVRRPSGFDASDPIEPAYRFAGLDRMLRRAVKYGLRPIVIVNASPQWARAKPRATAPKVGELRRFARALAERYDGRHQDLPRVRLWQVWNEPNADTYLTPQFERGRFVAPSIYRRMVNELAASVRAVHRDNLVIAGGFSPFTVRRPGVRAIGPLRFMRDLLCMSRGKTPRPTCRQRTQFDIWSHHPYTSGGPTHHAYHADDVSLGDLPEMQRLLAAAVRAGHVGSRGKPRFWVTEFSWDSKPPDPNAIPLRIQSRWVSEALHRMWSLGIDLVTWFQLRDESLEVSAAQAGLYFAGADLLRDRPKPTLTAFRFPFVAYAGRGRVKVWGRTPEGKAGRVVVEESVRGGWRRLAVLRANRFGIFAGSARRAPRGSKPTLVEPNGNGRGYARAVLADNPLSYWRLGDSGRVARDERGRSGGTYVGGVRLGIPGALPGEPNRAVQLDGKNDRVALGSVASPRTVELWLKTEATRAAAAFSNRDSVSRYTFLGVVTGGTALAFDSLGLLGARWLTDGRWHHLVYTYGGAAGQLYVDGVLDFASAWTRVEGVREAVLGYDATLKTHFRGTLDEVALYDYALSAAQVAGHYRASGQRRSSGEQFPIAGRGVHFRARMLDGTASSLPFSLARPRDFYIPPFGR